MIKAYHIADLHIGLKFNNYHKTQDTLIQAENAL